MIYSQTLSNTCVHKEDFDKHALNMKPWFFEWGQSKQMIDSQIREVKFGQRLKVTHKQGGFGIPFVITYHCKLKKLGQIMKMLTKQNALI